MGGRNCGVTYERKREKVDGHWIIGMWALGPAVNGDSGGPVWDQKTKKVVGILSATNRVSKQPCVFLAPLKRWCPRTFISPLLPFFGKSYPDGAMTALGQELVRDE
jgi:hypothetical protein